MRRLKISEHTLLLYKKTVKNMDKPLQPVRPATSDDAYSATRHSPRQARAKERVRQILSATSSLATEVGVDKITTNLIAERAGLPVGSIYKYFKDKRAIIATLYDLYATDIARHISSIRKDPLVPECSTEYILDSFFSEWISFVHANRIDILRNYLRSEPVWPEIQRSDEQIVEVIGKLLQKTRDSQEVSPVQAKLIYRMAMAYEAVFDMEIAEAEEYYAGLRQAALAILGP